jgi:hypothetical protein
MERFGSYGHYRDEWIPINKVREPRLDKTANLPNPKALGTLRSFTQHLREQ